MMPSILFSLPELVSQYNNWVRKNPQNLADYETTIKWLSYFIAGRINNSHIVSELVYCLSNLLVFYNDRLIDNSNQNSPTLASSDKVKLWLSVLEYSEMLLELSVKKAWGEQGKWIVVVTIQIIKCIGRLILLYKHKATVIQTPPIPQLERKTVNSTKNLTTVGDIAKNQLESFSSFTLTRSGRLVRTVDASPPLGLRTWQPLQRSDFCDKEQILVDALVRRQLIAETIYVAKPVVHLVAMACFGTTSWKQWVASLMMDITSLQLYNSCKSPGANYLSPQQQLQVSRRTMLMVLYLLRSPFYEKHSKDKIQAFLTTLAKNVPLAGLICTPLAEYVPFWQSNYFYMWAT